MPSRCGLEDWQVTLAIAKAMGYDMSYDHPYQIMDEIAASLQRSLVCPIKNLMSSDPSSGPATKRTPRERRLCTWVTLCAAGVNL